MALRVLYGNTKRINERLLEQAALEDALVLDCAHFIDASRLAHPLLDTVQVISIDMLAALFDALKQVSDQMPTSRTIVITTFEKLVGLQTQLKEQILCLLEEISERHNVFVGMPRGSLEMKSKNCIADMALTASA